MKLKVAEHSFSERFCDAIQHVHKDFNKQTCRQWSDHFIYSITAIPVLFFHYNWTQCIDGFSLLLQSFVRKDDDAKNPAIGQFRIRGRTGASSVNPPKWG